MNRTVLDLSFLFADPCRIVPTRPPTRSRRQSPIPTEFPPASTTSTPNAALYAAGQEYATLRTRQASCRGTPATFAAVAAEAGCTRDDVIAAVKFTNAVDRIVANCGGDAKELLLSGHIRLPAKKVRAIANTHRERQRYALAQARAGRDPLGKPPFGIDPPFDTHDLAEVASRLWRNAGLLGRIADGLRVIRTGTWPGEEELDAVRHELDRILDGCRTLTALSCAVGGELPDARPRQPWKPRRWAKPADARHARRGVASVRGITEKNVRELPRVLRESSPTKPEADGLRLAVRNLEEAAVRFRDVIHTRDHDPQTGPSRVFGTYVVVYHLPRAVTGRRVGGLGTFDFPAGYYAYLGSAFGGGGVRARTDRHLTVDTPRKWNVDWLKPLCTPAAVWWTHERQRVEFDWADLLADLPGATVPAVGFGAGDNAAAEAHLVRFDAMPAVAAFRQRVEGGMPGHAPIHEKVIENWTGRGWPH